MRDEELPGIIDASQPRLVVYEYRRVSSRRQRNGPTFHLIRDKKWVRRLPLWESAGTAGAHEHRTVCLSDHFYRPTAIFAFLDISETYEVCKVCRASWDVPVITRCEGPDRSAGTPRLVVP